jgi:hypothetical protein
VRGGEGEVGNGQKEILKGHRDVRIKYVLVPVRVHTGTALYDKISFTVDTGQLDDVR